MDVTAVAGLIHGRLGHEGHRFASLRRDFLHALLENRVHVSHGNRLVVDEIDLVLSPAPFAFAGFDGHFREQHVVANLPEQWFVGGGLHDVVIDPVIARRRKVSIATGEGVVVRRVEQEEFQLAGDIAYQLSSREPFEL